MVLVREVRQAVSTIGSYSELKRRVREALARGRERAQEAVERERVKTCWEIGKLIQEHILLNKERSDYGQQVVRRLSADLEISNTELKYMLEFARTDPIGRMSGQLSWSQIQSLLAVNEAEKREELAKRAAKENWTVDKTRSEVKKLKAAKQITVSVAPTDEPLVPIKGTLGTYRILIAKAGVWRGKPVIDLGFSNYLNHPALQSRRFKERDIIKIASSSAKEYGGLLAMTDKNTLHIVKNATEADLFTYRAYVFDVTDGDTLWVVIDLGFGVITQQQLRLRGIDAPEIASRDGQRAKRFVESQLKNVSSVIITSTQSDKYDRYLADIFYETKQGEQFLNNRLLKENLAERVVV